MPLLSIRNVSKVYYPRNQQSVLALDQCNLDIAKNEFCVIVGPSGCGKTTLLNIIAGFENLTEGSIVLNGSPLAAPGTPVSPGPDRMVVFQHGGLFPWMRALENVCFGPIARGQMTPAEAREKARSLMARVDLHDMEDLYPEDMSSGMRRRLEIIRSIIGEPEILLMDEPFRALDAMTKAVVQDFLLKIFDTSPHTIFFITHDLTEAIFLADKVYVMTSRPGRLKKMLSVNLPRPRTLDLVNASEFLRLKDELTDVIHEEAQKAFELGEREAAR
ncbi:MAG TPA: ABC transporter ATP-binding protein [Xanthobacteraceae bacterium]|jgi:NitT/TauT family transport system ATP-binding protein|nr:ABC transporter ATP-binding protein [Xanthobacteraceae bacterium]